MIYNKSRLKHARILPKITKIKEKQNSVLRNYQSANQVPRTIVYFYSNTNIDKIIILQILFFIISQSFIKPRHSKTQRQKKFPSNSLHTSLGIENLITQDDQREWTNETLRQPNSDKPPESCPKVFHSRNNQHPSESYLRLNSLEKFAGQRIRMAIANRVTRNVRKVLRWGGEGVEDADEKVGLNRRRRKEHRERERERERERGPWRCSLVARSTNCQVIGPVPPLV